MIGVTTALVGFIFVCVVFPHLVKNRPQFYAALAMICGEILLDALGTMSLGGFRFFAYAMCALLQVGAILLLFLAAGGITWRQLAGDMSHAIEVIRRGGEREVIVPLTGEMPRPRAEREGSVRERVAIKDPLKEGGAKPSKSDEKIPLA